MRVYKCDKCLRLATEEEQPDRTSPSDWVDVRYSMGYSTGGFSYDLCPECAKRIGISEDHYEQGKSIGERLIEILEEIAQAQNTE